MEFRKASDILLDLEKKMDIILSITRSQDLNIKILSNKLNSLIEFLKDRDVSEVDDKKKLPYISAYEEDKIFVKEDSSGQRRNSRHPINTFVKETVEKQLKQDSFDVIVPLPITSLISNNEFEQDSSFIEKEKVLTAINQRVVNANGKSLFLAEIEVVDLNKRTTTKFKTNGTGKWSATLEPGKYRVSYKKIEAASKKQLQGFKDLDVIASDSIIELETMVLK